MAIRRSQSLSDQDRALRLKALTAENKRLRELVAKLEVANISLKNENGSLKKLIETKANEKFTEILGSIMQRAGEDCGPGPSKSRAKSRT
jgi:predicted nuclease with TOPRIM domain